MYAVAGVFALSVLFCLVSFLHSSVERFRTHNLINTLKEYQQKGTEVSDVELSYQKWKNIGNEFDQFKNTYLMRLDDYSKFRNDLTALFARYQLSNQQIQNKYRSLFKEFIPVEIVFTVKGSYSNIKHFVSEIQSQKKIVLIKSMEFSREKKSEEVSCNFIMEVYLVR